jgi:hypothetical protein
MSESIGEYVPGDWSQLPGGTVLQCEVGIVARDALLGVIGGY